MVREQYLRNTFTVTSSTTSLQFNWRFYGMPDIVDPQFNDAAFLILYDTVNNTQTITPFAYGNDPNKSDNATDYSGIFNMTVSPGTYKIGFAVFNEGTEDGVAAYSPLLYVNSS